MSNKYTLKQGLTDAIYMLKFVWRIDKTIFFLKALAALVDSFNMILGLITLRFIIDLFSVSTDLRDFISLIVILQAITVIGFLLFGYLGKLVLPRKEMKLRNKIQIKLLSKAMSLDLSLYEDSEHYIKYTTALNTADAVAVDYLNRSQELLTCIVSAISIISLILVVDIYILGLAVLGVLFGFFSYRRAGELGSQQYLETENINRISNYIKRIAHGQEFSADIRAYNMSGFIINKFNEAFKKAFSVHNLYSKKSYLIEGTSVFGLNMIMMPVFLIYLSFLVLSQSISVGDFLVMSSAFHMLRSSISPVFNLLAQIQNDGEYYMPRFKYMIEYEPKIEKRHGANEKILDKVESIIFEDVYFKYPGHEQAILSGVSFKITSGKKVAIVGRNGTGKSTIIKLLLRFYDVDQGDIFINGVDIKEYEIDSLRKAFGTMFQKFNIYAFSIAENILLNAYNEQTENSKITCATKFSGLDKDIEKYEGKENSYIGREFSSEGIELSGGQYQKIAISRAYARESEVMIMDEPNSYLDPVSEYHLNKKLLDVAGEKTTIIISHRLSTATMCDEILLLDEGVIKEAGTHHELLDLGGIYLTCSLNKHNIMNMIKNQRT